MSETYEEEERLSTEAYWAGDWRRCRTCQRIHQQTADRKRGRAPLQAAALGEPKGVRR